MKVNLSSIMTKGRSKGSGRGIKVVRERYSDLNQLIGDLSLKLSEVSSSIDNEFLSAYRVHMVDVQEDLKSLKQQVATAESALHDDSAVATLETEVNWFSDETSRLKSHAMSMRKDMHHILSRIEALNEQRRFLNDQLKQILKRSKVLELEINGTATLNSIKIDDDLQLDITLHGNTLETDTASTEHYYDFSAKFQITNEKKNISGLWRGGKPSRATSASASDVLQSSQLHAGQSVKDTLISSSSSKNISSNLTLRRDPSYHLDQLLSQRTHEEAVLEEELGLVYREILPTKKPLKNMKGSTRMVPRSLEDESEQQVLQHCRRMGGMTGLGLSHFSDEDRIRAVQGFLMDPESFEKVVQVLAVSYAKIG